MDLIERSLSGPISLVEVQQSPEGQAAVFSGAIAGRADGLFDQDRAHDYWLGLQADLDTVLPQEFGWEAALANLQMTAYRQAYHQAQTETQLGGLSLE